MPLHEYHPTLKTATKTHFRRIIRNACRANILALSFIALESPTSSSFAPSFVLTCTKLIRTKNPLRTPFLDVALASEKSDFHDGSSGPKLIPIAQLKELKDSVDIVSAIESFGLQKFQRRDEKAASAICPFHDDHSPSLSIDGNRKIFKCFACGAGGDIFKFVREYNRLQGVEISFYQAVRDVAEKFSDNKVFFQTSRQWNRDEGKYNETQAKKERILLANAAAALFYSENLVNLPAAGRARSHLRSRGLSPTTVKAFGLGYAPDAFFQTKQHRGSGSLVEHLCSLGFSAQDLVEAGLAVVTNYTKEGLQTKGIVGLNSFNASESRGMR
jgi:DNA primase